MWGSLPLVDLDVHLDGIVERDEETFAYWMAGAEPAIRRSLRSFATSVDVEAVVQETLLGIWQIASRHRPDGRPDSLLRLAIRIARNMALDEARRAGRKASLDDARSAPDTMAEYQTSTPDPLLKEILLRCLERLRGKPRDALVARLNAVGESDRELATPLGMAVNTFRQNVSRARKAIQQCLGDHGVMLEEHL